MIQRSYRKLNVPENAKCVFEGVIFDVYQWEQELYDGSKTIFEKLVRPDTAIVYPVLATGEVLLVEDVQPTGTYICAPGGRVDTGESNLEAAMRELLEETGYVVEDLVPLYEYEPNGKIDQRIYAYIGKVAKKVQDADAGAGEKIKPKPVSIDELIKIASRSDFDDQRLSLMALEAQLDPVKMQEFRKLFSVA